IAGDRTPGVLVARPPRPLAGREVSDRPTGAAERSPGVALDNELRRARVLNGREPRQEFPTPTSGAGGSVDMRPTGVVARPSRPTRAPDPGIDPRTDAGRDVQRIPDVPETTGRPARPARTRSTDDVPARPEVNEAGRPARVPARPSADDGDSPSDRPARHDGPE
ncbi:MAG: hypothetical protein ABR501_07780, partial [Pyrinomonadaceae bacterium]